MSADVYERKVSLTIYLLSSRLYCRSWNCTKSCARALADCTADRELHPALKTSSDSNVVTIIMPSETNVKSKILLR